MLIFWLFGFTIGQELPIEFRERSLQDIFYTSGFYSIPILVSLLVLLTVRQGDKVRAIALKITASFVLGAAVFYGLLQTIFVLGFGSWKDYSQLYVHENNEHRRVMLQIHDIGAFGYGGFRVVDTKPVLAFFKTTNEIDTNQINGSMWKREPKQIMFQ